MIGSVIEGLFIALFSWESFVFYLIVTGCCMAAGGYWGWNHKELAKKYLTAIVGSYIFMRGWTYYFGGFPSELEMYSSMTQENAEDLEFGAVFWVYMGVFLAGIFLFVYIQQEWAYAQPANKGNS